MKAVRSGEGGVSVVEQIEKMGIGWVLLSSNTRSAPATYDWLAEFGDTYLA